MTIANYQFFPWTRRGLVAEISQPDADVLPARATIKVAITVNDATIESPALSLYGPGDVVGIDPRLIVRVSPNANSANVEPNYFAAIDFDPPDFPWLFTPAKAGDQDRLRPWLVLIVVDQSVVSRPGPISGALLPVLTLPADVVSRELPDLSESSAWAHTQMLTEQGQDNLAGELATHPNLNVSRLLCPRHLEPNKQYYACVVPAFDLGVQRGLGGEPPIDATLKPAWDVKNPTDLRLPLYYHWEFATGALGDFESLARKLKPYTCPPTIGFARLSIGAAGPELPAIAPTDASALVWMDGALRAPNTPAQAPAETDIPHIAQLADIPAAIQQALQQTLNAPADQIQSGATDATPALGPPIYGEWHINQHRVADPALTWFYELNLDLRSRVAAGLGAEVVRKNQEDFMQACWEQVGKILQANELLNRARFSMTVARSIYQRHYQPLPQDRFLQVTAPIHSRILETDVSIRASIGRTSLPDAALDPSMRRLTSPQRPLLKALARQELGQVAQVSFRSQLVSTLAAGRADVDPNQFVPDGLVEVKALAEIAQPADLQTKVNLAAIGLPIEISGAALQSLRTKTAEVQAVPATRSLSIRENLRTAGLVTSVHLRNLSALEGVQLQSDRFNVNQAVTELIESNQANPGATAFLVSQNASAVTSIQALDVNRQGQVLVRTRLNQEAVPIATIDPALFASHRSDLGNLLTELQPNVFDATGQRPVRILPGLLRRATVDRVPVDRVSFERVPTFDHAQINRVPIERVPIDNIVVSNTLPPLVKDVATISRFETAVQTLAETVQIQTPPPTAVLVAYALPTPTQTILSRLNPITTVPSRVLSMLTISDSLRRRLREVLDPILPAPDLPAPIYLYLTKYDQTRFLPGIDQIPNNTMTLLETNPRFIEAFLIGLNHEMNRELLWRAYPTDQRGTPFRHFWGWTDGNPDIDPIHTWNRNAPLGSQTRGAGQGGQLVLLIRGEVLFRYPNTIVYAWRAEPDPTRPGKLRLKKDPFVAEDLRRPVFSGQFPPDYTLVGFDLTDEEVRQNPGWYFVLEEQPTEPRFGLDESSSSSALFRRRRMTPDDLSWETVNTPSGVHLSAFNNPVLGADSAHVARMTLQKPMRVAIHSRSILETPAPQFTRIFPEVSYVNL